MSQRFSLYEQLTVDQNIRFFARHLRASTAPRSRGGAGSSSRWPASTGASGRARRISPAGGASGWRSAAPSSTSRRSCFSTSRPAASIRCRAGNSGTLIDQLSASGVTVLVTTHYLDEAEHCHRIAIIHAGKLAALGSTERAESGSSPTARSSRFSAPNPVETMRVLDRLDEVEKTSLFGTAVHAVLKASRPDAVAALSRRAGRSVGVAATPIEPRAAVARRRVPRRRGRRRSARCVRRWRSRARSSGRSCATGGR